MTEKPTFTPGPWRMETVRTSCGVCHRVGPFPVPSYANPDRREGWACVYDDYPPGSGTPHLVANAALIAAAPEMYEALKDAANSAGFQYMLGELRDRIDAALAKAEGRS